jgi:predicted membrane channel-forming protein YqfA (hemolysin III family)
MRIEEQNRTTRLRFEFLSLCVGFDFVTILTKATTKFKDYVVVCMYLVFAVLVVYSSASYSTFLTCTLWPRHFNP